MKVQPEVGAIYMSISTEGSARRGVKVQPEGGGLFTGPYPLKVQPGGR